MDMVESGRQACRFDAGSADFLVFVAGAAAGPGRTQDVAMGVLDQDGTGLGQQFALGRRSQAQKEVGVVFGAFGQRTACRLYTSPSPRDATLSRMPSSA